MMLCVYVCVCETLAEKECLTSRHTGGKGELTLANILRNVQGEMAH